MLPVSDLAEQVYSVFKSQLNESSDNLNLIKNETNSHKKIPCNLKVLLLSNKHHFAKEQAQLVDANGKCMIDIVVTTPGRLVDHLQKTKGIPVVFFLIYFHCEKKGRFFGN